MLTRDETRRLYRKRAPSYDRWEWAFRLAGVRMTHYRVRTVEALNLRVGDTAVEIGCGTGLDLPFLVQAVGPEGRVVGVDLSDAMLGKARERVAAAGWTNVELVESDAAAFDFPSGTGGVMSMLALTLVPEYDDVVRHAAEALRPGGRLALFDMKEPASWPDWLVRLVAWLNRPFGVSMDLAERHPWESVRRYLQEIEFREVYGGALYLSVGERPVD